MSNEIIVTICLTISIFGFGFLIFIAGYVLGRMYALNDEAILNVLMNLPIYGIREHDNYIKSETIDEFVKRVRENIPSDVCDEFEATGYVDDVAMEMKIENNE